MASANLQSSRQTCVNKFQHLMKAKGPVHKQKRLHQQGQCLCGYQLVQYRQECYTKVQSYSCRHLYGIYASSLDATTNTKVIEESGKWTCYSSCCTCFNCGYKNKEDGASLIMECLCSVLLAPLLICKYYNYIYVSKHV